MIDPKEIESLRHTEYNSDPTVMEMLDTIEALYKENAELKLQVEPHDDGYYGGVDNCNLDCGCDNEVGC